MGARYRLGVGGVLALVLLSGAVALLPDRIPDLPDRPLDQPLPARPLRITVFGTSLSAPPQIWPAALEQTLSACHNQPVQVQRITGPGRNSDWAQSQIGSVLATQPDLILMEFAINDADLRHKTTLAQAHARHMAIVASLRAEQADLPIVLMTLSGATGLRRWIRPRLGAHHAQYGRLAAQAQTGFIDLHRVWRSAPKDWSRDGLHPDPDLAADLIVPELADYLMQGADCAQL